MKITNEHIGISLWVFIVSVASYYVFPIDYDFGSLKSLLAMFTIIHHVFMIILIIYSLLVGEIQFEINIPNPFKSMIEAYKQKREYLKELNEIYHLMAKTDSSKEMDFLISKKEHIEKILKIS